MISERLTTKSTKGAGPNSFTIVMSVEVGSEDSKEHHRTLLRDEISKQSNGSNALSEMAPMPNSHDDSNILRNLQAFDRETKVERFCRYKRRGSIVRTLLEGNDVLNLLEQKCKKKEFR
jgi:hypothetical protein